MGTYAGDAARALHESTKHGTAPRDPDRLVHYQRLDPTNEPRRFKRYRDLPVSSLPRELVGSEQPAVRVLSGETGDPPVRVIDATLLSTLLYLTGGVTRTAGSPDTRQIYFRAAMSAGNLHPVELYVVAGPDLDGIEAATYHFAPLEFGLTQLRKGDFRGVLTIDEPVALVLSGVVWRTAWKYGERGWRHLYWDAGAMLANLLPASDVHGLNPRVITAFDDKLVGRLIGIDGVTEVPLAVVTLGPPAETEDAVESDLPPLELDVAPIARNPMRLPLLEEAQAESRLRAGEMTEWRQQATAVAVSSTERIDQPAAGRNQPIEEVILSRGSTRVMRPEPVAEEALSWPVAAATRAVPWDLGGESSLLSHYLNIHGVDALAPGAYRWGDSRPGLISKSDQAREIGAALCLNQPLGGDSAYTAFHQADLVSVLAVLGSRGYRTAQLEAGIVSGRLALCAFALDMGATGLTFFDDAVSQYFQTSTAPMLVTSVGPSETRPAPAGTPGNPAQLGRYGQVIGRMTQQLRRAAPGS